jgi:hypothetical protein
MKHFLFSAFIVWSSFWGNLNADQQSEQYSIHLVSGEEIKQIFPLYRHLYLVEFKEYPYLYVGTSEEVEGYITFLKEQKDTAAAVAYHNEKVIGFVCATSLVNFGKHFEGSIEIFKDAGLNPEDYYYIADAYIQKEHQGNFLSKELVQVIENHGKKLNFKKICFAHESHQEHPLKPTDYKEIDSVAHRLGYLKTNLSTKFTWNTRLADGQTKDQEHVLDFWAKDL